MILFCLNISYTIGVKVFCVCVRLPGNRTLLQFIDKWWMKIYSSLIYSWAWSYLVLILFIKILYSGKMKRLKSRGLLVSKHFPLVWCFLLLLPTSNWWWRGRSFSAVWVTFKLTYFLLAYYYPSPECTLPLFLPQWTPPKPNSCIFSFENPFQNV